MTIFKPFKIKTWQHMDEAVRKEGPPILVIYDHDADSYYDPSNPDRLTDYAANTEIGDFLDGKGVAMVVWCDPCWESEGWENPIPSYHRPGCWFEYENGDASERAVNAVGWIPIPPENDWRWNWQLICCWLALFGLAALATLGAVL